MAGKFVYDFLAGIRFIAYNEVYDRYDIQLGAIGRWLFGFAFVFLIVGAAFQKGRQIEILSAVRYKSKSLWWQNHFLSSILSGLVAAFVYWLVLHLLDNGLKYTAEIQVNEGLVLLLWLVHILVMICLYCFLNRTVLLWIAPVILLVAETLTIVFAFYFTFHFPGFVKFMFGTWGMYMQSEWIDSVNGFSVALVLFVEFCIMLLCFLCGLWWIRKKDWNCCYDIRQQ